MVKSVLTAGWRRFQRGARRLNWALDVMASRAVEESGARVAADAASNEAANKQSLFYGGQAVIEGVMMRGQYVAAVAVRKPTKPQAEISGHGVPSSVPAMHAASVTWGSGAAKPVAVQGVRVLGDFAPNLEGEPQKGEIAIKEIPLNAALYRGRISRLPFVRGLVGLWDALVLGTGALMWSADVQLEEEEEVEFSLDGAAGMGLVVVSLAMGIGLFFVIPAAGSAAVKALLGIDSNLLADTVEGVLKLGMLVGYIWAISHMEDVKRLFGYHGAEHKTINAYEDGATLEPATVSRYPIEHPRCGTAFLLTLVVLSVVIHMLTGRPDNVLWLLASRVLLIFPIASIAYETIRWTARHLDNPLVQIMIKPNLAMQHLTTRDPDHDMIEVGIAALERVLAAERAGVEVKEAVISTLPASPAAGD